ncbi:LMBR1-like membrane protein [Limtongia smithiae]|uniref:LMBR1-like membrane protein n=1 Tax=Limtongia smithiae TaxID=1125753 RepID=UPI0034CFCE27
MLWLSVAGFTWIGIFVILLITYYCPFSRTPNYLLLALFCAVYISFSIILLVPIDLATSTSDSTPLLSLPSSATFAIWRVVYWLSFALTWVVLPMLQSYLESGHTDSKKKFYDALRANARHQLLQLMLAIIGFIYFFVYAGLSVTSLKALVIALSHSYALITAMLLMGIGLVNIPRSLFLQADPAQQLAALEEHAPKLSDHLTESRMSYRTLSAEVQSLRPVMDGPFEEWINGLLREAEDVPASQSISRLKVNENYLSGLTVQFKKAKFARDRYEAEWNALIEKAVELLDILDAPSSRVLRFRLRHTRLPPQLAYYYYSCLRPLLCYAYGAIVTVFSALVIVSECLEGTNFSLLGVISAQLSGVGQEIISLLVVGYMCFAAYSSLAKLRLFNIFILTKRHTDWRSAIFYATQACRLTIPLSYSYVNMVPRRVTSSVFEEFLEKSINLTPLGMYFVAWLPRFILIPVAVSAFNLYGRVQRFLGFQEEFGEDDALVGNRAEGRDLIRYELGTRMNPL